MDGLAALIGESDAIARVRESVSRLLALTGAGPQRRWPPVLLRGETGTGKGLLARLVHEASARGQAGKAFVPLNCAAIPESLVESELFGFERGAFTDARQPKPGLVEVAHGGTLFLDEIGLLAPGAQAKLLTVLEDRLVRRLGGTRSQAVDVWIMAATSADLEASVRDRQFREDLYHRLAVMSIVLPPLRERGSDVLLLAERFLEQACADYGLPAGTLSPDARAAVLAYPWPGNVRELTNAMERVALLAEGSTIGAEALRLPPVAPGEAHEPDGSQARAGFRGAMERFERLQLLEVLTRLGWNLSRVADALGIPRNTLKYRMKKHGLLSPTAPPRSNRPGRSTARPRAGDVLVPADTSPPPRR